MATVDYSALLVTANEAPGGGSYEPLPPGKYRVEVDAAEPRVSKTGKTMFNVTLIVKDGPHAGRKLWRFMVLSPENPTALSIFFRQMAALGLDGNFFGSNPDESDICAKLIGGQAMATVALQKDDPSRNDVKELAALVDPTAPAAAGTSPSSPPASPF